MHMMQHSVARELSATHTGFPSQTTGRHCLRGRMLDRTNCSSTQCRNPGLVTCAGQQQSCAAHIVDATEPVEQPATPAQQQPSSPDSNTSNKRKAPNKAAHSGRPTARRRTTPPTTKRKRVAEPPDKRAKKKPKTTLSYHIGGGRTFY